MQIDPEMVMEQRDGDVRFSMNVTCQKLKSRNPTIVALTASRRNVKTGHATRGRFLWPSDTGASEIVIEQRVRRSAINSPPKPAPARRFGFRCQCQFSSWLIWRRDAPVVRRSRPSRAHFLYQRFNIFKALRPGISIRFCNGSGSADSGKACAFSTS